MSTRSSCSGVRGIVLLALVGALIALVCPGMAAADDPSTDPEPVPSLDPDWSAQFVPPAQPRLRAALVCRPVEAVFYAQTDWLRLAQKLRSNPSACASYYVSIPPLAADKTALRVNQAGPIRALGPQMHPMAEINVTGWSAWVAADSTRTWFDAGIEARRRMAAAGFDVNAGDIWAVNEFSSAVRTNSGAARRNMRELVRGLYVGDGSTPPVQGLIWVTGIGQPTTSLDLYKNNLKLWMGDAAFWGDMSQYVRFYSQEVYGSITNWAVPGATTEDRLGSLTDYIEHTSILAGHAPSDLSAMSGYLAAAEAPTGNAAWPRPGFGWPPAGSSPSPTLVQAYVAAQVYAFRHYQATRPDETWGFAWNPLNFGTSGDTNPPIPDFVNKTATILDRLAASIHGSDTPTDDAGIGACGTDGSWCAGDLPGSASNTTWHNFDTWSQPVATDSTATIQENTATDIALDASDADGDPLTYAVVDPPAHGTLTGDGPTLTYTPAAGFYGSDSFTFNVSDGVMLSRTATVSITVNAPPSVTVDEAGPVDEGAAPIPLTAHASDPDGDPVTLTWSTPDGTATFASDDGPATATVAVTADDGRGGGAKASIEIEVLNIPPTADAGPDVSGVWGMPVTLAGAAPTDPSKADTAAGLSATWDFGDGSTGNGYSTTHLYADPGTYTATLTTSDKDGGTSTDTTTVVVGPRTATLATTFSATLDGAAAEVAAQLGDGADGPSAKLEGHAVTFASGSSNCVATTNAAGLASCTLPSPPLGPQTVTASFTGDSRYTSANRAGAAIVYRMPAGGAFAVGDRSASGAVTFWSGSWWLENTLSDGASPSSFKGFAQPSTAGGWTAAPGLAHVPATVPEWMGVLVTKSVSKDGPVISGDTVHMVVVHVDAYDPALAGRGTVVASMK
jgi:hypothetical protein